MDKAKKNNPENLLGLLTESKKVKDDKLLIGQKGALKSYKKFKPEEDKSYICLNLSIFLIRSGCVHSFCLF